MVMGPSTGFKCSHMIKYRASKIDEKYDLKD